MVLRFLRRERSQHAQTQRALHMEKAVIDGFRSLADALKTAADFLERRRLTRQGYASPKQFLERSKPKAP